VEEAAFADEAQSILSQQGADNVAVVEGELRDGAATSGPYDVIILQGAVESMSDAILDQLEEGGRIACLWQEGALGVVRIGYKLDGQVNWRFSFNASAPVLPGFERHAEFSL
jgi:protein-L-isoaspartate(D-aspartate) O-methyltransferase